MTPTLPLTPTPPKVAKQMRKWVPNESLDACYDSGGAFWLVRFLHDGTPYAQTVQMSFLSRNVNVCFITYLLTGHEYIHQVARSACHSQKNSLWAKA